MYKAMFVTAYFRLFRVGEIAESQHVVKVKDVHIGQNKRKLMFLLHSSKTHNKGSKPQIIKINRMSNEASTMVKRQSKYCPFNLLQEYAKIRIRYQRDDEQSSSFGMVQW